MQVLLFTRMHALLGIGCRPQHAPTQDPRRRQVPAGVVLLSALGGRTRPEAASHAHVRAFEDAVQPSVGTGRSCGRRFVSNAFWWAETVRTQRTAVTPFGDVEHTVTDPAGTAAVAASPCTVGAKPTAVVSSPRQQAHMIGDALATPVRFAEQTPRPAPRADAAGHAEALVEGIPAIQASRPPPDRGWPDRQQLLGRVLHLRPSGQHAISRCDSAR